jgi:hypothetical protein
MAEAGKNDNSLILGVNSLQNRPLCRYRGHRWRVRDKARPRKAARISVQECFADNSFLTKIARFAAKIASLR